MAEGQNIKRNSKPNTKPSGRVSIGSVGKPTTRIESVGGATKKIDSKKK